MDISILRVRMKSEYHHQVDIYINQQTKHETINNCKKIRVIKMSSQQVFENDNI